MAIHLKQNPVGIDKVIDRLQKLLHDPLNQSWGSVDVYGRVYKVEKKDGISLERYVGNGEYQKVLFSEGNKVFFIQGSNPTINQGIAQNELWLVGVLRLETSIERQDEEAHETLLSILSNSYLKNIVAIEYGMDNLRRVAEDGFSFGNFKYSDIHPYHVFMVKMNVEYSFIKNNC